MEIDYCFLRSGVPTDPLVAVLVGYLKERGAVFATACREKGRNDQAAISALHTWCMQTGLSGTLRLRSDLEPSIRAVASELAARRTPAITLVETSPECSSGSTGGVERAIQSVAGLVRTLRTAVEQRWGRRVVALSPVFPWLINHASFLIERFQKRGRDGCTAYEAVHERPYLTPLFPFGAQVMMRMPEALKLPKLDNRWIGGIWLGRRLATDENIVGTPNGIFYSRTCKRMMEGEDKSMYDKMLWTPWHPSAAMGKPELIKPALIPPAENVRKRKSGETDMKQEWDEFVREFGKTPNCPGCRKPRGHQHNATCRVRRKTFQEERQGVKRGFGHEAVAVEDESAKARKMGPQPMAVEPDADEPERQGAKHARDTEQDEALAEEELEARGAARDGRLIQTIGVAGPPWFDEYTGQELSAVKVDEGMNTERRALNEFKAKTEVPEGESHVPGALVVPSRWLLKVKGEGVRARLVAQEVNKGTPQDTYSATPTVLGQRLLLQVAASRKWVVQLADVSTAFLHAPLPKEPPVFLIPPETDRYDEHGNKVMWLMHKAIYGLRQSPRIFQEFVAEALCEQGWTRLIADAQLYQHKLGSLMMIHADDIMLVCRPDLLDEMKETLAAHLKLKWMETLEKDRWVRYLGKLFMRTERGFLVRHPEAIVDEILTIMGLENCKPVATPGVVGAKRDEEAECLTPEQVTRYRSVVGKCLYLSPERLDIMYQTKEQAKQVQRPTTWDWEQLKRLGRYLSATRHYVMRLEVDEQLDAGQLEVVADASWANSADRRSTTGGVVRWQGFLLAGWSRTQAVIAQSSAEAELMALNTAGVEGKFAQSILAELGTPVELMLFADSNAARAITQKKGLGRMRHVEIRQLWLQSELREGRVQVQRVPTKQNVADILTKVLARARLLELCSMILLGAADTRV